MISAESAVHARFNASRFGEPSNDDQLTLIAMISPNRPQRASISSGSSRANEDVRGHHAPSRGSPSSIARATRTGLAKRRPGTAPFMVLPLSRPTVSALVSTNSIRPQGNPGMARSDPSTILHFELTRHTNVRIHKPRHSQRSVLATRTFRHSRYTPRVAIAAVQPVQLPR